MPEPVPPQGTLLRPFRWDLARPDHLGTLLDDVPPPDLWYLEELTTCSARILARCGNADMRFVGRSADSIFDLLTGVLQDTSWRDRLGRLPLSLSVDPQDLAPHQLHRLREHLAVAGLTPYALARRRRPLALVDLVWQGRTFTALHTVLRAWTYEQREPWPVIRRKLQYIGVTWRHKTSPNTDRWQQDHPWTRELPARNIVNVSLDGAVWHLLGDVQPKTARSFPAKRWHDETAAAPRRSASVHAALAEARALLEAGRSATVRNQMVRTMATEPAFAHAWLRSLTVELRRPRAGAGTRRFREAAHT